jgi:tetratricopeptide (TPR) repeat protein
LLDLVGSREVAILATDLSRIEWRSRVSEPTAVDAVRLVQLLRLDTPGRPMVSVGDADVLHAFLRNSRRVAPTDVDEQAALAALYRYLASSEWLPAHLAADYGLRANILTPRTDAMREVAAFTDELPEPARLGEAIPESVPAAPSPLPEVEEDDLRPFEEEVRLPTPGPLPPDPHPRPEPPLPIPEPVPQPGPMPEPGPEPEPEEPPVDGSLESDLEEMHHALEKERKSVEAYLRTQLEELRAKEELLADREQTLESKEQDVEARDRAVTERLVALEKDAVRREVLTFLGSVPGMTEAEADVIATAFPDMASLRTADVKALTQCKGVTDALARAIRFELVPGEVEGEDRSVRLREEAQAFLEEGDYVGALACYDRLLRERPEDMTISFDRAELLVLLNRPEEALECYTRVLDADRRNRRAWFERANLLFGLGQFADAIDALREALRIEPAKSGDIVSKAEQLRRDGHPNDAVVLFQAVLDVVPDDPRSVLGLGDCLLDLGDSEAAEALFSQALGKNPQNAPILYRKGELLERKGRWGAAIQYYNRAIALGWNFAEPWLAKAEILLAHDRAKEALECFEKVASFDPGRVESWAGQARAHVTLDRPQAAREALAKAILEGPEHPAVLAARAAVERFAPTTPAIPAPPESFSDLPSLAKAFEEIEEEPEPPSGPAVSSDFQTFIESIEPEKEDTHVLLQLAELALEGGDAQMALVRYGQVLEREPRSADGWTGKGVALQHLERYQEALEAYDHALELKPNHEIAQKWRATCARHLEREGSP